MTTGYTCLITAEYGVFSANPRANRREDGINARRGCGLTATSSAAPRGLLGVLGYALIERRGLCSAAFAVVSVGVGCQRGGLVSCIQ